MGGIVSPRGQDRSSLPISMIVWSRQICIESAYTHWMSACKKVRSRVNWQQMPLSEFKAHCAGGEYSKASACPGKSHSNATEDLSEEQAYLQLLFSGSEAQQKKYEEENKQVGKMFEEYRNSSAAASMVSVAISISNLKDCMGFP